MDENIKCPNKPKTSLSKRLMRNPDSFVCNIFKLGFRLALYKHPCDHRLQKTI